MAAVVLTKFGRPDKTVVEATDFVNLVYGQGYLPKTGTVAEAWQTIDADAPTPPPDPNATVSMGQVLSLVDGKADKPVPDSQLPDRLSDVALRAAFATRVRGPFGAVPVATESAWYDGGTSNGTDTWQQTRKRHVVIKDATDIRFAYANMYNRETAGPNAITVRAGLEVILSGGGSTWYPIFFGGKRDATVDPLGIAVSDRLGVDLPAGTVIYSRTLVTVASAGMRWPKQGSGAVSSGYANLVPGWNEGSEVGTGTPTDKTTSGTITLVPNHAVGGFAPVALLGAASGVTATVGIVGDSIPSGFNDGSAYISGNIPPDAGRGWVRRGLGGTVPYVSIAASGESLGEPKVMRAALIGGVTDVIMGMGINDLVSGATASGIKAGWLTHWTRFARQGARVHQATVTPKTTSTDSWATTGNQTPFAGEAHRVDANNWLRDGAPINSGTKAAVATGTSGALRAGQPGHPLTSVIDVADRVEPSRNSGVWQVGLVWTGDSQGIHPSYAGHIEMAKALSLSALTNT